MATPEAQNIQDRELEIQQEAEKLEQFLASDEGLVARELLASRNTFIRLGEERIGNGLGEVYFLDGEGLKVSQEAMDMWVAYAKSEDIPKPEIMPLDAVTAVRRAIGTGRMNPNEVVSQIRNQLSAIANKVG